MRTPSHLRTILLLKEQFFNEKKPQPTSKQCVTCQRVFLVSSKNRTHGEINHAKALNIELDPDMADNQLE